MTIPWPLVIAIFCFGYAAKTIVQIVQGRMQAKTLYAAAHETSAVPLKLWRRQTARSLGVLCVEFLAVLLAGVAALYI